MKRKMQTATPSVYVSVNSCGIRSSVSVLFSVSCIVWTEIPKATIFKKNQIKICIER